MGARDLRLGIDLGTSAVKVVLVDSARGPVATGEAAFETRSEALGEAEQAPRDWLAATAAAVAKAGAGVESDWPQLVTGIGLAGQLPTLVALGVDGPLGNAIAWSDSRADAWAGERLDPARKAEIYRRTGMPIDGRYLAPMYRFHWHDRRRELTGLLSAKDYLCFALTGCAVTDPSTAAGYGVHALGAGWDPELCSLWDLDPILLPEIRPAQSVAAGLDAAGATLLGLPRGIPVSVGSADSVAGALAMTGAAPGAVSLVMGSGTVIIDAVRELRLDPARRYLLTPHALPGWFGREMDVLAVGSGFRWLGRLLGRSAAEVEVGALASPAGARGLFFAPYLAGGEQGALWDPTLAGALHGLTLHHGPGDVARAFLEGAQFEIRRCVEVLAETSAIDRVVVAGHFARSAALRQMLADILNRPVEPFSHISPAALGATLLAPGEAPRLDALTSAAIAPGPAAAGYEAIFARYGRLFPKVARPEVAS